MKVTVVFPTPVGVFLPHRDKRAGGVCLPHARGGVSGTGSVSFTTGSSSPRPWGCFLSGVSVEVAEDVFPTPVGVFPDKSRIQIISATVMDWRRGEASC